MKMPLVGRDAICCIRVFLIAACLIAGTSRLSANIILLSRLSDAEAGAFGYPGERTLAAPIRATVISQH